SACAPDDALVFKLGQCCTQRNARNVVFLGQLFERGDLCALGPFLAFYFLTHKLGHLKIQGHPAFVEDICFYRHKVMVIDTMGRVKSRRTRSGKENQAPARVLGTIQACSALRLIARTRSAAAMTCALLSSPRLMAARIHPTARCGIKGS